MSYIVEWIYDRGIRGSINEDAVYVKSMKVNGRDIVTAIVCDGVGGLKRGEVASGIIVHHFKKIICSYDWSIMDIEMLRVKLDREINHINKHIYMLGNSDGNKMGSTITALFIIGASCIIKT